MKIHKEESQDIIPARDMKAGEVAEIVSWGSVRYYDGVLVIRLVDHLYKIDGSDLWSNPQKLSEDCKVRLLPNGTLLEITNNRA